VNYPDEVGLAQELGLDVVVIDHHQPGPRIPACPVVHSSIGDYPHHGLCGVGLALKVLHALHVSRLGAGEESLPGALAGFLDLVALGTIADLAPLVGENRCYVQAGLKLLGIGGRPGLRALMKVADCHPPLDSTAVGYRLAPRLNAAGRLTDPSSPLRLLLTVDEREGEAIAAELQRLNGERQEVEREILESALQQVSSLPELPPALVLHSEGWHEGVVGIVASRLVERFNRPTVLLGVSGETAKGSGRSILGYDIMAGLDACADLLTVYGGHQQAAGLTLPAANVERLKRALTAHATGTLSAVDLRPGYRADAVIRGEELSADTALALAALGPFGTGNPRPRLLVLANGVRGAETTRSGGHLRCTIDSDGACIRGIGFGLGEEAAALRLNGNGAMVGTQLRVSEWQGNVRPELHLECIRHAADRAASAAHHLGTNDAAALDGDICGVRQCASDCPLRHTRSDYPSVTDVITDEAVRLLLASPDVRDARRSNGHLSLVAQVLASGGRTVLVVRSMPERLEELTSALPLAELAQRPLECRDRGCRGSGGAGLAPCEDDERTGEVELVTRDGGSGLLLADWDSMEACRSALALADHVMVLDPPFRPQHLALLARLASEKRFIHLCFGDEERAATENLIRFLVHPRFAMVCLYRALAKDLDGERALSDAARTALTEQRVSLTHLELSRARAIIEELGIGGSSRGLDGRPERRGARIDARVVPTYRAAEAVYEESIHLCRIL
jgi:single-stranded-DNA-specific exonuclease RecJ